METLLSKSEVAALAGCSEREVRRRDLQQPRAAMKDRLHLEEFAQLEGITYQAARKRLNRARVERAADPDDSRRKLVPVSALSPQAYQSWLKGQTDQALQGLITHRAGDEGCDSPSKPVAGSGLAPQALLPFRPLSPSEKARQDAVPPGIPVAWQKYLDAWLEILGNCIDGTWRRHKGTFYGDRRIEVQEDYIRATAHRLGQGFSAKSIHTKKRLFKQIMANPALATEEDKWRAAAEALVPKPRPGRSGHSFFEQSENLWMFPALRGFYLKQARFSMRRAHGLLCQLIDEKQRAAGLAELYSKPTFSQSRTILEKLSTAEQLLGREGDKAYNDACAPYLSRRPPAYSNLIWVTDQRECNVRLRDGSERLGRIWVVNFLDVASERWLGCGFAPVLSSDLVMVAAAMALERAGVPRAVHMDLGKEFVGHRFLGGVFKLSGMILFGDALGLWERLKVAPIKSIGRNPQSKTIERWHQHLDKFDQNFPGYRGRNPGERPPQLQEQEAQHAAWLAGKAKSTPLLTIPQYINAYFHFVEHIYNAEQRGRGKYRQGMTPNEAWNVKRPSEGFRILTAEEINRYTADRRLVKVARGGQVNLTFYGRVLEYLAPELFLRQGEEIEVLVSRRSLGAVKVIYRVPGGTAACVARLKPQQDWLPEDREELRAALRCKAALKRAIKKGIEAQQMLERTPLELLGVELPEGPRNLPAAFGAKPARRPLPRTQPTSSEIAEAVMRIEEDR
jgi:hypothetical protein